MNKKGQTMGIAILSAIIFILIGLASINFLFDPVTDARAALSCSTSTISDGTKLLCLVFDLSIPYWVYLVFAIMIGTIAARMYL